MDPYLEGTFMWPDFHFGMNAALREYLNHHLPDNYVAVADRYIWIHEPDARDRLSPVRPDVHVAERTTREGTGPARTLTAAPVQTILPAVSREGNRFIRVLGKHSRRVVTVIELLSPANKMPGPDREAYLLKRNTFLASQANVIEIDLLRRGERMPLGEPAPAVPDYCVLVLQASEFPKAGIWPFSVRMPLPEIPVPLKGDEPPLLLPLKKCFDHAYEAGRYRLEIDYNQRPDPPLNDADEAWARQLIATGGATRPSMN